MILYFALTIGVSLVALVSDLARNQLASRGTIGHARRWGISDLLIVIALVAVPGHRYYVGTDYYIYANVFGRLNERDWQESIANSPHEIGYTAFSLIVKGLSSESAAIIWATSLLTVVPIYVGLRRLSSNRALTIFLYIALGYYFIGFNQIRQSIALGLTVLAFSYFRKSRVLYVVLMALAASFHISALIVPIAQIATARWRATYGRLAIMAVAMTLFGVALTYLGSLANVLNDRYGDYIENATTAGVGTLILAGVRLAIVMYGLATNHQSPLSDDAQKYILFVAGSVGLVLLGYISVPAARIEMYFSIYATILLPILAHRARASGFVTWLIVAAGFSYMYVYVNTFNGVLPYQTESGFFA